MTRLEEKIEKAILPLVRMYEEIENELLIKIASHFLYNEEFLNSDYWRIKKLEEMGLFNQEIIDYIARYTNKTPEEILKALQQIGVDTVNLDNLNRLFEDEVLKIDPVVLADNYVIKNMINSAYNELNNRFIQMSNKIQNATREAYLNVVEEAYLKTSMGTHSYQEAIRSSIDKLSNNGLTILKYTTTDENNNVVGIRNYDITSTVRREVLTASRQLSNNISMQVVNELDCEYLYLSEHVRCRPDHFDWQGTIIKKEDLVPITDYGSIIGLAGINCAHYFEPYFGYARGNDLKTISKEKATKEYNLSQKQRYLERGVRKWKRKANMFKVNNDEEASKKSIQKTREWQSRVQNFVEENNLRRDYTREYVKTSQTLKPSQKLETNNYKDVTSEWKENAKPNTHVVQDMTSWEHDGIVYVVDGKNVVLDYSDKEKEVAEWLENTFGGELYMMPRVNKPDGIMTADYLFKKEYWDLKEIFGNGKHTLDSAIKKKKSQAKNFIFDISNSEIKIESVNNQISQIYKSKDRKWLDKILVKRNNDVVVIYERK